MTESTQPCVGAGALPPLDVLDDIERLERDPATRMLIRTGQTIGCFYIESPAMRSLFARLKCSSYRDVVAASSIIRPGVAESGMMKEFILRYRHPKRIRKSHPRLDALLEETFGVMVYQEDVIRVAHEIGGLSLAEADLLRRAMSGKGRSREAMKALSGRFLESCAAQGIGPEAAADIWRQIESFAGYSFCKGHSAAFAVLSFQVAWLKAHYPAEFLAAVLANGGGFYAPAAYVSEARRMGLRVLPPDVNAAQMDCAGRTEAPLPPEDPPPGHRSQCQGWIRVGFRAIRNFPEKIARRILEQRDRNGPFASLKDFLERTRCGHEAADKLIRAGGFDAIEPNRARSLLALDASFNAPPRDLLSQ